MSDGSFDEGLGLRTGNYTSVLNENRFMAFDLYKNNKNSKSFVFTSLNKKA